jgi:nicotinate-nucleotide adenylyltransferase
VNIGILSGSFDPVHVGHIGLALAAKEAAKLDAVYLTPEVRPRRKAGVTHIAHRIAMLELAVKPHQGLFVLEFNDKNFTPAKILPKLHARFPNDKLYFICGEDMLTHMPTWPLVSRLLEDMTLVVGRRNKTVDIEHAIQALNPPYPPVVFSLDFPKVASSDIRQALATHQIPKGLLKTSEGYIKKHWLYAALFSDSSKS